MLRSNESQWSGVIEAPMRAMSASLTSVASVRFSPAVSTPTSRSTPWP